MEANWDLVRFQRLFGETDAVPDLVNMIVQPKNQVIRERIESDFRDELASNIAKFELMTFAQYKAHMKSDRTRKLADSQLVSKVVGTAKGQKKFEQDFKRSQELLGMSIDDYIASVAGKLDRFRCVDEFTPEETDLARYAEAFRVDPSRRDELAAEFYKLLQRDFKDKSQHTGLYVKKRTPQDPSAAVSEARYVPPKRGQCQSVPAGQHLPLFNISKK